MANHLSGRGVELVKAINANVPIGKVLHRALTAALIAKGNANDEASDDGKVSETISPSLVRINRLLKQRDDLAAFCGEMLSTFRLPGNQEHFAKLPPTFAEIVERWTTRFGDCSGEP